MLNRGAFLGEAGLERHFERYAELADLTLDWRRIRYYEIFVQVRMAISCLGALERPSGQMNAAVYFNLPALLDVRITKMIAVYEGTTLQEPALPVPSQGACGEVIDALIGDLTHVISPALADTTARQRAGGSLSLLMHLREVDRRGAATTAAELRELAQILGSRPATLQDGWAALEAHVGAGSGRRPPHIARVLPRDGGPAARVVAGI